MYLKSWELLPYCFQNKAVKSYYEELKKKRVSLLIKRIFDFVMSTIMLIIVSPVFLILSIWIKIDSKGAVLFCQTRITQYNRKFRIYKFRTMVSDAEHQGTQVTTENDNRITRVGRYLRKCRLDELPQLLNVLKGDMSFVGTRPEVPKYVESYSEEMLATLLLPAGITSEASIQYKDEEKLLSLSTNVDETYVRKVLPEKMKINLRYFKKYSFFKDIKIIVQTVWAVLH